MHQAVFGALKLCRELWLLLALDSHEVLHTCQAESMSVLCVFYGVISQAQPLEETQESLRKTKFTVFTSLRNRRHAHPAVPYGQGSVPVRSKESA